MQRTSLGIRLKSPNIYIKIDHDGSRIVTTSVINFGSVSAIADSMFEKDSGFDIVRNYFAALHPSTPLCPAQAPSWRPPSGCPPTVTSFKSLRLHASPPQSLTTPPALAAAPTHAVLSRLTCLDSFSQTPPARRAPPTLNFAVCSCAIPPAYYDLMMALVGSLSLRGVSTDIYPSNANPCSPVPPAFTFPPHATCAHTTPLDVVIAGHGGFNLDVMAILLKLAAALPNLHADLALRDVGPHPARTPAPTPTSTSAPPPPPSAVLHPTPGPRSAPRHPSALPRAQAALPPPSSSSSSAAHDGARVRPAVLRHLRATLEALVPSLVGTNILRVRWVGARDRTAPVRPVV
ncbi:hypothetical protein C8J57DRAFT_1724401 [Mycena rebaudengoi]|nr:hypothetical protein C8J57DRAFT_1724401 [Mycena rebaudengoi]